MSYKNLVDCHTHSKYSPDAEVNLREMVETAHSVGLKVLTVTDHCECNGYEDDYKYKIYTKKSIDALNKLKAEKLPIKLCTGVEMGQAMQNLDAANEILGNDLDFVIGSLHNIADMEDFYYMDYDNMTNDEALRRLELYYTELLSMCKWGNFDSLGHLTYPFRYMEAHEHIKVDINKVMEIIAEIFKEIIKNDKAIEINTSIFKVLKTPLTIEEYIKFYILLGGSKITVGSDAHQAQRIGDGVTQAYDIIKACGLSHVTYFENRNPILLEI